MKKKIVLVAVVAILTMIMSLVLASCTNIKTDVQEYTVGNGSDLTIGVISDTQLSGDGVKDKYYYNYVSALKTLKDKNVDTIMFIGDVTDLMTKKAANIAAEAWVEVFESMDKGPIKNYIMGNHDYWLAAFFDCWDIPTKGKMQSRFTKATGEKPYSHKVVNGYHFINASPANGDMSGAYDDVIDWMKKELDKAVAADSTKPIFVNTHNAPFDTVVASDYGEKALAELFKQYPQVVSISGHSHASLMSERSIWQGEYTALQSQSLSYTCFEDANIENGMDYDEFPMGMIITLKGNQMTVDRIDALSGESVGQAWTIDLPIKDNLAKYSTETRKEQAQVPVFSGDTISVQRYNGQYYIAFPQANTNSVSNVRYYEIKLLDWETQKYYEFDLKGGETTDTLVYISDFFERKPAGGVVLELKRTIPKGKRIQIEVVAREEFGKASEPILGFMYT